MKGYGGGTGTTHAYAVEVRTINTLPPDVHPLGFIIDKEWRRVPVRLAICDRTDGNHYQSAKIGDIPVWNYCHEADHLHLMTFNAAYALACQIQAQQWNGICTECRIVTVEITYSYSAKATETSEAISLFELRRSLKFEKLSVAPEPPTSERNRT